MSLSLWFWNRFRQGEDLGVRFPAHCAAASLALMGRKASPCRNGLFPGRNDWSLSPTSASRDSFFRAPRDRGAMPHSRGADGPRTFSGVASSPTAE